MMAVDRRMLRLRRLVSSLLECILLLHVMEYVPSVEGDCIWYGMCSKTHEFNKVNCYYDGPARPVQEETRHILDKYCPELAPGPVCCDNNQLRNLDINIRFMENVLGSCRPCMVNFLQHICGMACGPNQSDFIKPVSIERFNSTHRRVREIDYFLSATYKNETFDSCKEVPLPENNEMDGPRLAFEIICGEYGAENCTADRWFECMGDGFNNPFVPFQINYVGEDEPINGYVPYNPAIRKTGWNEEGCQVIKLTTSEFANKDDIETTTIPNTFHNHLAFEDNTTNLSSSHNITVFETDFSSPNKMTYRNYTLYKTSPNNTYTNYPLFENNSTITNGSRNDAPAEHNPNKFDIFTANSSSSSQFYNYTLYENKSTISNRSHNIHPTGEPMQFYNVTASEYNSTIPKTFRNRTLYQNKSTISNSTLVFNPNQFSNYTALINNSTILNESHKASQFNVNSTQCPTYKEMGCQQEQRKLQVEEDYYSFKKDYLRQKLVLLKEQTEILRSFVMEWKKILGH